MASLTEMLSIPNTVGVQICEKHSDKQIYFQCISTAHAMQVEYHNLHLKHETFRMSAGLDSLSYLFCFYIEQSVMTCTLSLAYLLGDLNWARVWTLTFTVVKQTTAFHGTT